MDVWYSGDYGISFYEYGGELTPLGKFLGHTWKDWSLIPTVRPFVVPPPHKTSEMDAKGINGKADVSNKLLGFPLFNNREGSWTFYIADFNDYSDIILDSNGNQILDAWDDPIRATKIQDFTTKYSQLLYLLQGKNVAIVLDEDPIHFYKGTVQIESFVASNDGSLNGVTIKYDLYPYKMKIEETVLEYGTEIAGQYKAISLTPQYPMITVPWLLIVEGSAENPIGSSKVWFDNAELNIHAAPPGVENYNFSTKIGERFKMTASYGDGYPTSHPTCAISNLSGSNQMQWSIKDRNGHAHKKVQLIYREGRL